MPEQFYATPSSPVLPASRALCDGNMELGKMRAALLKEERSTRTLTAHLAKITTEHESLKKKLILERRSTERITAKLHSQLKGSCNHQFPVNTMIRCRTIHPVACPATTSSHQHCRRTGRLHIKVRKKITPVPNDV